MTSLELRKINNYPEWNTLDGINSVINFIQNEEIPEGLNARQQQRFQQKFDNGNWVVEDELLFYRPPVIAEEPRINLVVSRPNDRQAIVREIYNESGSGNGLNKFYAIVASQVLGITRNETSEFLKKQGNYQITRPIQKITNSPILARIPNERWGCDVLNVSRYGLTINRQDLTGVNTFQNQQQVGNAQFNFRDSYKQILVVVDYFSKKVWAKQLRNERAIVVRNAFAQICEEANTFPRLLQVDKGRAFLAEFRQFCNQQEPPITLITTTSYSPISNGLVERLNKEIRKHIREGLVKHNSLEWVEHLQEYCENINNGKSSTTGFKPNELWSAGYNPLPLQQLNFDNRPNDNSSRQDIIRYVEAKLYRNALNQLERRIPQVYEMNDFVRIKIPTLKNVAGTEFRRRTKSKIGSKYNAITYSPTLYRVLRIYPAPQIVGNPLNIGYVVRRQQYAVGLARNNPNGNLLLYPNTNIPIRFFGSDFILVPPQSRRPTIVPRNLQRTRYINRFIDLPEGQQA